MAFLEPFGEEINPFTGFPFRKENLDERIARLRREFIDLGCIEGHPSDEILTDARDQDVKENFAITPPSTPSVVHAKEAKGNPSTTPSLIETSKLESTTGKKDPITPPSTSTVVHAKEAKGSPSITPSLSKPSKLESITGTKHPITPPSTSSVVHAEEAKGNPSTTPSLSETSKLGSTTGTKRPINFTTPSVVHAKEAKGNPSTTLSLSKPSKLESTTGTKRPINFTTPSVVHTKEAKGNPSTTPSLSETSKLESTTATKHIITPPSTSSVVHAKEAKGKPSITPLIIVHAKEAKEKSSITPLMSKPFKLGSTTGTKRPIDSVEKAAELHAKSTAAKRIKLEFKHSFNFISDNEVLDENIREEKKRHRAIFRHCEDWMKGVDRKMVHKELSTFTKPIWPHPRKVTKEDKVTALNINEFHKKDVFQIMFDAALNNPNLFECHENIYAKDNKPKIKRVVIKKRKVSTKTEEKK
uniref:Uncharacterized protein n=1 Tax=Panagrolaimus sp. ES5 TaxID=591445 RepID=A0AC34FH97_9BILA